ncbi:putative galacturonosyltransferase [Arachis hypogaea]|nr:putative galacturonosyltransferase [Arachis hypogaea]
MLLMLCKQEQDIFLTRVHSSPDEKDIDIIATYSDASGHFQLARLKMRDLSDSWIWENPTNENNEHQTRSQELVESFPTDSRFKDTSKLSVGEKISKENRVKSTHSLSLTPMKIKRRMMRQERRKARAAVLVQQDKETENHIVSAAVERSEGFHTTKKGKYSIWRVEYENPNSDSTLKLMRDQIIMAKAYSNIAKSMNKTVLYSVLVKHFKESEQAIGEANSDAELQPGAFDQAKAMGHILSEAKDQLYDCPLVARKLRATLQSMEDNVNVQRKRSAFLIQLAAKTVPRQLHCLPLQLAADYYLQGYHKKGSLDDQKIEDPSLYHYAIFSDNVLATSVVVNSTVQNAKDPEKQVFHIVTDKLNFAAMRMWFLVNPPANATIEVQNIDDFKWLNSSYCSVLRQLESARIKEYYFKANNPSSLSAGSDNLKYRNPKYLSMLNHLRFYLPEVYPKLNKVLFLDDDIVVQKDLTPLWSVDLKGMVNGAVETCKESFHSCGWAFGMNMFDLIEWKKRNITGIYHRWQDMNEDRTLWKLGTLPPGLITFYNLTYPLDRGWHVLGLGYDPALNLTEIENAAVIHYNGNYKPWLNLAVSKYQSYWSRYVMFDNPYIRVCNLS